MATSKSWPRILEPDPEKPGPWKSWTLKHLDSEKAGPWKSWTWKSWTLKNLDHEQRGTQLDEEER